MLAMDPLTAVSVVVYVFGALWLFARVTKFFTDRELRLLDGRRKRAEAAARVRMQEYILRKAWIEQTKKYHADTAEMFRREPGPAREDEA